jgi:hypothetical protein
MSLKLSSFAQALTASDQIDYIEVRLGEQYVIPFTVKDSLDAPIDITNWDFATTAVTSEIYTANFTYSGSTLSSIKNFSDQGDPTTDADLKVTIIDATIGSAVLTVPASITPRPSTLVTLDDDNTLLNLITITANYPSSVAGFNNIRKMLIGLVVRFGG